MGFSTGFWIAQTKNKSKKSAFGAPGLHHISFMVESENKVDEIYK